MKRRDANAILVALAAIGGGVTAYSVPVPLLEMALVRSGFSGIVPAAAPPLGSMARGLFLLSCGLGASVIVAAVLPWGGRKGRADGRAHRGSIMTFAFSKLAFLSRGRNHRHDAIELIGDASDMLDIAPSVRRSDAHPDAPPRPPLMASRDLGEESLPPVEDRNAYHPMSNEPREPLVTDITGLAMPRAPEPLPWETIQQEMDRLLAGMRLRVEQQQDLSGEEAGPQPDAVVQPSIRDLTERLERGLARRRATHASVSFDEMPKVEAPEQRRKEDPILSAEGELGEALATLRNIAARAG